MMADTIELPGIGAVDKTKVIAVGGLAGGVVVYAWWRSRGSAGPPAEAVAAPEPEDPFEGSFGTNGAAGAVSGYPSGPGSDTATTAPRTNAEWSQLAFEKLADSYEPPIINGALGRFLGRQPLSTLDQEVVRAAIGRAGYPPEGSYTVIPGGNTDITVPVGGVKVSPSFDRAVVSWSPVAGAGGYQVARSDQGSPTAVENVTTMTMFNLDPGREYKIQVAAVASGKRGPWSSQVVFKTTSPTLRAPAGLRVVKVERTQVTVSYSAVAGAAGYVGFRTGAYVGAAQSQDTRMTIGGLKPGTKYTISVAARTGVGNAVGPKANISVTTKR